MLDRRHGRFDRRRRRQSRPARCGSPTKASASSASTAANTTGRDAPASAATGRATPRRAMMPAVSDWARQSARWMSGACHRSLYGYQMRTALALAVENPHLAVTFIPLGCSGATIKVGFLDSQRARECPSPGTGAACPGSARAQIAELTDLMATARKHRADRSLDLVLLTIGANDIHFSGLIARRHHRAGYRTQPAQSRRHHRFGRGRAEGPRPRAARQFRQAACRAQADGRRKSVARRLCAATAIRRSPAPTRRAPAAVTASTCIRPSRADGERLRQAVEFVSQKISARRSRRSHAAKTARPAAIPRPSA